MDKPISKPFFVIAGALLFSLVFWQEKLGLNALLFDSFIVVAIFYLYSDAWQSAAVRWLLAGHLLCLAMILLHNTLLSKVAFSITLALLAVFAEYRHRSAWFAAGSLLLNIVLFPASFVEAWHPGATRPKKNRRLSIYIRFAIIPVLLAGVFFLVYCAANRVFQAMATEIGFYLQWFWEALTGYISVQWLFFLPLGLAICASILLKSKSSYFKKKDLAMKNDLQRTRRSWVQRMRQPLYNLMETVMGRLARGPLALKNENTVGVISLILLNLLLLLINGIDLRYIWLGAGPDRHTELYKQVHEGAGLLTLSIVLAMLVLLFFFKGNLNFYTKNKWLKLGAYCWIVQNCMLAASVFLRDYYYIRHYGLAYKRIGVLFFLLMVLIGLLTVLVKIWKKKTTYFLFRVNAWAGIVVLVVASCVHWDELMAAYNLRHRDSIPLDVSFLMDLSDKTLPLLDKNVQVLQDRQNQLQRERPAAKLITFGSCDTCFIDRLHRREERFLDRQRQWSWLSWNYADAYVTRYLTRR